MSRLDDIRSAVEGHVITAFANAGETVTTSADPNTFDAVPQDQFPHARIIFIEDEPERLDFLQQRRRVNGEVAIAMVGEAIKRETVDSRIEAIRDLIFGDLTLGALVDTVVVESGTTVSNPDENFVYGTIDITTEEVF